MGPHTVRLADDLDELGFWNHLPAEQRRSAHDDVAHGSYPFKLGVLRDWVFVDADVMEEGRGEQILTELAPILSRHGLQLNIVTAWDQADIVLTINGIACHITDTVNNPLPATYQPFGIVNHLLARAGASVRLHLLYPGTNFGIAHILNPEIINAVRRAGSLPDHEIPELVQPFLGHS